MSIAMKLMLYMKRKSIKVMPLEGAEKLTIEGESYEAFNTSGGCATMCETYENKVENLSYKTIRYPGHLNHMKFYLMIFI